MKKSLKSNDKLRLGSEFAYMRQHGKKYVGRYLILVTAAAPDKRRRCGVICGKKYSNKAVIRNRARRLLWESFRLLKAGIAPAHLLMIPRRAIMNARQPEVEKDLLKLLQRAQLYRL